MHIHSRLLPSPVRRFLHSCWRIAVPLLDPLFHGLLWVWKHWILVLLGLIVLAILPVVAQFGLAGLLQYQHWAIITLIVAQPLVSGFVVVFLGLLVVLSWCAHRSPWAHEVEQRETYLCELLQRTGTLTLPIGEAQSGLPLETIYQPLQMLRDPLAAEDIRDRLQWRRLPDEPPRKADDAGHRSLEANGQRRKLQQQPLPVVRAANGHEALQKSKDRRMIVLGGPGTGKTTLLKALLRIAILQAQQDVSAPLPIFLSLPDLALANQSLQEYLASYVRGLGVAAAYAQKLWDAVAQGHAFLCLDSLDEATPRHPRDQIITSINQWTTPTHPLAGNTWIIGSRFTEYKGGQFGRDQFTEWELQPLDESHQLELAQHLLPRLQQQFADFQDVLPTAEKFLKVLRQQPHTRLWAESPLLLSLAAVIYVQQQGNLPSTRVQLYQQIMKAVLSARERNATEREILRRVLEEVALTFYQAKQRTFTRRELVIELPKICQAQQGHWEPVHMVKRLQDSGLIDVVAHDRYGFRHQTFYEYLTAAALAERLVSREEAERKAAWDLICEKCTYSRWTEVLRMLVGVLVQEHGRAGMQESVHWLRTLVRQRATEEGDPGDLGLALVFKSLGEVGERPPQWEEVGGDRLESEVAEIWVEALLSVSLSGFGGQQEERLQALVEELRRLSAFAVERSVVRLLTALRAGNSSVRRAAVETLGELGEHAPVERLLAVLNDQNAVRYVRWAAVRALGRLGERAPVEQLVAALGDKASEVRRTAVWALGRLGERAPVERLLAVLDDQNEASEVRRAAVRLWAG